jgi:hypothetical protein
MYVPRRPPAASLRPVLRQTLMRVPVDGLSAKLAGKPAARIVFPGLRQLAEEGVSFNSQIWCDYVLEHFSLALSPHTVQRMCGPGCEARC